MLNTGPYPSGKPNPIKPISNETVYLRKGQILSLPCVASMDNKNSYGVCYGNNGEDFPSVLNKTDRCVYCNQGVPDCTNRMSNVSVTSLARYQRKPVLEECNYNGVVLNVTDFEENSLTFYCFWRLNYDEKGKFAQYYVILEPSDGTDSNNLTIIIISCGGFVAVAFIILLVCLVVVIKLKHRAARMSSITTVTAVEVDSTDSGINVNVENSTEPEGMHVFQLQYSTL